MSNLVPRQRLAGFGDPRVRYTVSGRRIRPDFGIREYLQVQYVYVPPEQIESVYGSTVHPSPLYGGRTWDPRKSLHEGHLLELEGRGVGVALTLTSHFFEASTYQATWLLLERLHRPGNALICQNDELARQARRDFPHFRLKASVLKNLQTADQVARALELYDLVVVPMDRNDDDAFLGSLPEPSRLILFGNATCAYNCPARTCYVGFSQANQGRPVTLGCSQSALPRQDLGEVFFDVRRFADMGFRHIKLVTLRSFDRPGVLRALAAARGRAPSNP